MQIIFIILDALLTKVKVVDREAVTFLRQFRHSVKYIIIAGDPVFIMYFIYLFLKNVSGFC